MRFAAARSLEPDWVNVAKTTISHADVLVSVVRHRFSLSVSFFWTRNERGPSGVTSEATQHCCENNCHNIHYHDQAEQTVKKDIW